MIPEEKSEAVARALEGAFGVSACEDIRQITKGQTPALVFRIVVKGRPYLLRMIMWKNPVIGPERQFTCMKLAADAGLAPRVWYTSTEDRISITDFVEEVPFPAAEALTRMPAVLRALHSLPPFPKGVNDFDTTCMHLLHKGTAADGLIQKFQAANILSKPETEQLLACYQQVAAVYPRADDLVSSHNDLFKPDNILFDANRVWLVDWEAAFLNDRYADLAVVANLIAANEDEFLQQYFGQPPTEYQAARFFLMQQFAHMFYAMAFLWLGSAGKPVSFSEPAPGFEDFHRRFWAGEIILADNDIRIIYGRIHWERLAQNMRQSRFKEALRIVATRTGHL